MTEINNDMLQSEYSTDMKHPDTDTQWMTELQRILDALWQEVERLAVEIAKDKKSMGMQKTASGNGGITEHPQVPQRQGSGT